MPSLSARRRWLGASPRASPPSPLGRGDQRRRRGDAAAAAGLPGPAGPPRRRSRAQRVLFRQLTLDLLRNTVELAVLVTRGDGGSRGRRRLVHRAHRAALPPGLGGADRAAGGGPRLHRRLRLALHRPDAHRAQRRGARDEPRPLPAGLPAGRGGAAAGRSGAGGDGAIARLRTVDDLPAGHAAADPPGPARRLPRRHARAARRVRRVRDPELPDLHDRDLHRVPASTSRPPRRWRSCWSRWASWCLPAKVSSPVGGGSAASGPPQPRPPGRRRLGKLLVPTLLALTALVGLSLGVPDRHAHLLARCEPALDAAGQPPPCCRPPSPR